MKMGNKRGGESFQSTLLMRGATQRQPRAATSCQFQSTLLMRGATRPSQSMISTFRFQSTLLMRGATAGCLGAWRHAVISIHAPHARSDAWLP